MGWTDPVAFVAGAALTASDLNVYVKDNLKAIGDAWQSYTPTWTASTTNPTIGNGSIAGAYMQAGKFVAFRVRIVFGSTTAAGSGNYSISLPVAANSAHRWTFVGTIYDASGPSELTITATALGGSTVDLKCQGTSAGGFNRAVQHNVPITTWATGDEIVIDGTYEAA